MADKGKQGFASMDPQKAYEIRSLGGQAAHRLGKAHEFTQEEARKAGMKSRANSRKQPTRVKA